MDKILALLKKSLWWLITNGLLCLRDRRLPERPENSDVRVFVLPEYLKMPLSKSVMRNVARFRIRGHGLKCETGLYGRKQDCTC